MTRTGAYFWPGVPVPANGGWVVVIPLKVQKGRPAGNTEDTPFHQD
jgi:hypothetical protein